MGGSQETFDCVVPGRWRGFPFHTHTWKKVREHDTSENFQEKPELFRNWESLRRNVASFVVQYNVDLFSLGIGHAHVASGDTKKVVLALYSREVGGQRGKEKGETRGKSQVESRKTADEKVASKRSNERRSKRRSDATGSGVCGCAGSSLF